MITEARIATTDNITLSGAYTIQGVALVAGTDVVLVCGQTDGTTNGPYVVQTGAWTRHSDHDTGAEFVRPWEIFIREGTYANWRFQFINLATPTLGTSVLNFEAARKPTVDSVGAGLEEPTTGIFDLRTVPVTPAVYGTSTLFTLDAQGRVNLAHHGFSAQTFIDYLLLEYVGGATPYVQMTDGSAWIVARDAVIETVASGAPTGFIPSSANTMYYWYLYGNGGRSVVTTVPDTPYLGTARYLSGTASDRTDARYIGAFRTNGSSQPYNFRAETMGRNGLLVTYLEDTSASPFRVVSGGSATTNQTVNLGPSGLKLVPPTCRVARLRLTNTGTINVWLDNSEMSTNPAGATSYTFVRTGGEMEVWMPLDASQSFRWAYAAAGGNFFADVLGYAERR